MLHQLRISSTTHEWYPALSEHTSAAVRTSWVREGGWLLDPDVPGLGVELDLDRHEPVSVLSRSLHEIPCRRDGTWVYSV